MADSDRFARALLAVARGLGRIARERARSGEVTRNRLRRCSSLPSAELSTSTLATLLGIDPSTASRNLSGLERAGLIARQKGSDDGRRTDVRLTPKGRRSASVGSGAAAAFALSSTRCRATSARASSRASRASSRSSKRVSRTRSARVVHHPAADGEALCRRGRSAVERGTRALKNAVCTHRPAASR